MPLKWETIPERKGASVGVKLIKIRKKDQLLGCISLKKESRIIFKGSSWEEDIPFAKLKPLKVGSSGEKLIKKKGVLLSADIKE
ncbi:MAG: hypothetical protein D6780_05950 [Candidatus Dadabacteria bacterium]|nr:MAG: hypothetical protein D6780_05950 [Candidatus Dadabacteria bacterium]